MAEIADVLLAHGERIDKQEYIGGTFFELADNLYEPF